MAALASFGRKVIEIGNEFFAVIFQGVCCVTQRKSHINGARAISYQLAKGFMHDFYICVVIDNCIGQFARKSTDLIRYFFVNSTHFIVRHKHFVLRKMYCCFMFLNFRIKLRVFRIGMEVIFKAFKCFIGRSYFARKYCRQIFSLVYSFKFFLLSIIEVRQGSGNEDGSEAQKCADAGLPFGGLDIQPVACHWLQPIDSKPRYGHDNKREWCQGENAYQDFRVLHFAHLSRW